ncbi:hypothetical protein CVT26_012345 [Gymnopilus dilepis]|uniref:Uncharacterized protein n=1 Tax=Gymnopilus dilepis TaxID=231916 RepID=A0A409YQ43_9AGAR|nr:hypothetical protein CVT26_012345 [Gymnopilus dilepis]
MLDKEGAQDFLGVTSQLCRMTSLQLQAFLNYLSSRLRMMSCIMFTRHWQSEEEYSWFQGKCMEELMRTIMVIGHISCLHVVQPPPFLRRCMQDPPHISEIYHSLDNELDPIEDGYGDFWYLNIPARRQVPAMAVVLQEWSCAKLCIELGTETTPDLLSDAEVLSLLRVLKEVARDNRNHLKHVRKRRNELLNERRVLLEALDSSERHELRTMFRELEDHL